jgi:hypothetical protein
MQSDSCDDFEAQVNRSVAKHREMIAFIDQQTDPRTYVDPNANVCYRCWANGRRLGLTLVSAYPSSEIQRAFQSPSIRG